MENIYGNAEDNYLNGYLEATVGLDLTIKEKDKHFIIIIRKTKILSALKPCSSNSLDIK